MFDETTNSVFVDGDEHWFTTERNTALQLNNADRNYYKYLPKCWQNITKVQIEKGHGEMDWFCFKVFFKNLRSGKPMPVMFMTQQAGWQLHRLVPNPSKRVHLLKFLTLQKVNIKQEKDSS